jgi:dolichol-phosphate mannosyltransferase
MPKVSVIVPCYNEEAVLPQLFRRLTAAAEAWGMDYEVVSVNDGSRDRTWELLKEQHARDPRWRCLSFARNFGHQTAVSAGLYHAEGDAAVVIDADLQDPPESIEKLLAKWKEGYQVVYAVRKKRQDKALKSLLAWGFYRVIAKLVPFRIPADSGDYALLDRCVVDIMNAFPERNRYLRGLRAWCGFRQIGVEFERQARAAGEPQYTFKKSLRLAMDGVFSFSTVPLRLSTYLGFWISGLAFLITGRDRWIRYAVPNRRRRCRYLLARAGARIRHRISFNPARCAERQRRSPAMIIHRPVSRFGLTSNGSNTPFSAIEAVSSVKSPNSVRGCSGLGSSLSTGIMRPTCCGRCCDNSST